MIGFYLTMMTVYFVHAFVDCMCTVLVLFYPHKLNHGCGGVEGTATVVVDNDSSSGNNKTSISSPPFSSANIKIIGGAEVFFRWWNGLLDIYFLLFVDSAGSVSEPMFVRVFMYWMAAMSLTRVIAVGWPCASTLITVAVMYLLEALAIEFEGFTHKTVRPDYARKFSLFCVGMSFSSFLLAIFA